ncbi:glycosyltransferase [Aeoliella sp.]|uniref:glycosyltransferase n=1 Tax=Aeoliella sp. TaxID=2795800 RepID=UPI003CCBEF5C
MIFVTVGTHTPFDRLIRAVDEWASLENRSDVFAQIGDTQTHPRFIRYQQFLSPEEYGFQLRSASLVVGHAGTGTLLTSLQNAKPLVMMPRHSILRETRNDHQIAMAARFQNYPGIYVAHNENSLATQINKALSDLEHNPEVAAFLDNAKNNRGGSASAQLINAIRKFIADK